METTKHDLRGQHEVIHTHLSAPHNGFPFPFTMHIFSKDIMPFQAHMHSTFLDWDFLSPTVYLVSPGELCKHQLPTPAGCSTRALCVRALPTRDAYSLALLCYLPQSLHHPIDYLPRVCSQLRCRALSEGAEGRPAQNSPKYVWAQSLRWHS